VVVTPAESGVSPGSSPKAVLVDLGKMPRSAGETPTLPEKEGSSGSSWYESCLTFRHASFIATVAVRAAIRAVPALCAE